MAKQRVSTLGPKNEPVKSETADSSHSLERRHLLDSNQAAAYCGLKSGAFRQLLMNGKGPRRIKHFKKNLFLIPDLDEWMNANIEVIPAGSSGAPRPKSAGAAVTPKGVGLPEHVDAREVVKSILRKSPASRTRNGSGNKD